MGWLNLFLALSVHYHECFRTRRSQRYLVHLENHVCMCMTCDIIAIIAIIASPYLGTNSVYLGYSPQVDASSGTNIRMITYSHLTVLIQPSPGLVGFVLPHPPPRPCLVEESVSWPRELFASLGAATGAATLC